MKTETSDWTNDELLDKLILLQRKQTEQITTTIWFGVFVICITIAIFANEILKAIGAL